ncbi:MAG TPA: amidohydrolase family protein [Pseudomonadales bacterium]|nr:amidohydrolase family protein [Pseudomonadales bacterium]
MIEATDSVRTFFDSHLHIIDPAFPLTPNAGYLPDAFTVTDYQDRLKAFSVQGGAVVSGSFQAFDQTYLKSALLQLGPQFVGVTQLPASVSDAEIIELNRIGVKAVRFNLKRGGSESVVKLKTMAERVFELAGWHVELYVDSRDLAELMPVLLPLPKFSIDHLGLSREGFAELRRLVDAGCKVKATGFSRGNLDIAASLKLIHHANPDALMFGTDLPCTRAPEVFSQRDLQIIEELFSAADQQKIFLSNAMTFYGLPVQ